MVEKQLDPCVFAIPGRFWQGETCPKSLGGHKLLQQVTSEASAVLADEPRTHEEGSHVKEGWEENLEKASHSAKSALEGALFRRGQ